jgi:ABC-type multidrug transport system ATPase subunit/ABC-type transport system involved in multi-copper enzyme maturation permease subunit
VSDGAPVLVRAAGLARRYGQVDAVRDLHLTVRRGELYGFLGPNGAGKTTTLLMLLGIERPTAGTVELFGQPGPPDPFLVRPRIGVVGEAQYLYDDLSAWEYLQFFGSLYGVEDTEKRAGELLERLELFEFRRLRARDYSRGMQQKLGLARALLHRPELLILDEPVSGLDPHGIRQVREILVEERARGTTILLSSHILSEVERTADRVGILYGGRLVAEDTVERLSAQLEPAPILDLDVETLSSDALAVLRAQPYVHSVEETASGQLRVRVDADGDHRRAVAELVSAQGGLITGMRQERLSLEDAFVRLTQGRDLAPPTRGDLTPNPSPTRRGETSDLLPPLPDLGRPEGMSAVPAASPRGPALPVATPIVAPRSGGPSVDRGEGRWGGEVSHRRGEVSLTRLRAIWTVGRRDLLGMLYGPGIYIVVALGMLATLPIVAGYADAVERSRLLILADAFTLPFFVAATIGMLFLALASVATIAREREGGTLEVLFYGPVDHLSYVVGKGLAQLLAFLPIVLGLALLMLTYSGMTGLRLPGAFGLELLLAGCTAAAVAALGVFLSTVVRGVRGGIALLGGLVLLFLAVRLAAEVLSAIPVTSNLNPLLLLRNTVVGVDWLVGYISPFGLFQSGVDALVRGDLLAYGGMVGLAWAYCGILLLAAVRQLARRGVRR